MLGLLATATPTYGNSLVNGIVIPGNTTDLSSGGSGANLNRVGFFSDIYYDRTNNVYYGLGDRGPGGGLISYDTRVQKFTLDVDKDTGAISNFQIVQSILFTRNGENFNGLNPLLLNGNTNTLGNSFDPEGFALAPNGNFYVSDEYGPSLYEFSPAGEFIRAFTTPDNLIPRQPDGTINYVDGRPTITTGRQDNRGFEGLTISPDGSKLYATLQDPLVNEGDQGEGRRSRNVRIVEFDTATGASTGQFIYQLESIDDINDRLPGTDDDFSVTAQGRSIGLSAITALGGNNFLVLERDNRGLGVDNPTASVPVGSKRVYMISLAGATDVSGISLGGINDLPTGVIPVKKDPTPFIDIAAEIGATGSQIAEKFEGLTVGPRLNDGTYAIITGTDNDFSVTQTGAGEQFDVCTDGTTSAQVGLGQPCPAGLSLLPGFLYSFKGGWNIESQSTPEPNTMAGLLLIGLGSIWASSKGGRRQ